MPCAHSDKEYELPSPTSILQSFLPTQCKDQLLINAIKNYRLVLYSKGKRQFYLLKKSEPLSHGITIETLFNPIGGIRHIKSIDFDNINLVGFLPNITMDETVKAYQDRFFGKETEERIA